MLSTITIILFTLFTFLFANLLQICITNRVAPARGQILQVLVVEWCNDSVSCLSMKLEKSNGCICSVQSWHEQNPKQKSICKINNVTCFSSMMMTKSLSSSELPLIHKNTLIPHMFVTVFALTYCFKASLVLYQEGYPKYLCAGFAHTQRL